MPRRDKLPEFLRTEAVRPYYESLRRKNGALICKRLFDIVVSFIALVIISPLLLVLIIIISLDSPGGPFFLQTRVTQFGRHFRIIKFRTMVKNAEALGAQVTSAADARVTGVGLFLRRVRLDELPQLINILTGDMTFVGVRPEVPRFVEQYSDEMNATLLLPAGVTSRASILYKDEDKLLADAADADRTYVNEVLPAKMKFNLEGLLGYGFFSDIKTMFATVTGVLR